MFCLPTEKSTDLKTKFIRIKCERFPPPPSAETISTCILNDRTTIISGTVYGRVCVLHRRWRLLVFSNKPTDVYKRSMNTTVRYTHTCAIYNIIIIASRFTIVRQWINYFVLFTDDRSVCINIII